MFRPPPLRLGLQGIAQRIRIIFLTSTRPEMGEKIQAGIVIIEYVMTRSLRSALHMVLQLNSNTLLVIFRPRASTTYATILVRLSRVSALRAREITVVSRGFSGCRKPRGNHIQYG